MGQTVYGNKWSTKKGNSVFSHQWPFKKRSSKGSTGDWMTGKSTKKWFAYRLSNPVFMACKYKTYRCKLWKSIGHLPKMCNTNINNFINVEENEEVINMTCIKLKKLCII